MVAPSTLNACVVVARVRPYRETIAPSLNINMHVNHSFHSISSISEASDIKNVMGSWLSWLPRKDGLQENFNKA